MNLKPGRKGTKRPAEQYGESLLHVRYRYNESRGERLKTVEIVVEGKPRQPSVRVRDGDAVSVAVSLAKKELRDRLKGAGR